MGTLIMVVAAALLTSRSGASAPQAVLERISAALEIRFALSALPPGLQDDASVFVLDPMRGYVLTRQGRNSQSCFVERTEWEREEYRDDLYAPLCYDRAGADAQMQVWVDVAKLRASGLTPANLSKEIRSRFVTGRYALCAYRTVLCLPKMTPTLEGGCSEERGTK